MTSAMSLTKLEEDTVFQKDWQTYQILLEEDYIQHTKLYEKIPEYLQQRFSVKKSFSILDLGCGDVNYLSKTLQIHNIWSRVSSYTGVDFSEQAMHIGERNLRSILANDVQVSFVVDDMLSFVIKAANASYDFVFASISIHHLQDSDKERLVKEVRRILRPDGAFMIIDIFLEEDEDRNHFLKNIIEHVRQNWMRLNEEQADRIINHIFNFDFPAKLTMYEHWAKQTSAYKHIKCLETLRFFKTTVLEI